MAKQVQVNLPDWARPFTKPARWKSMRGGRGSSKSHTAAQLMIRRMAGLLPDYPPGPVRIVSARDFNTNLQDSVKVAVERYIRLLGLEDEFQVYALTIRHKNGSIMTFRGVTRNPDSFLSMDDIDVFWAEQAECLEDEMLKIEPTIRKPGSELWFVWNPLARHTYCWQRFCVHPQPGDMSVSVNFYDNPWWDPKCFPCGIRYDWDVRFEPCAKCGNEIHPGLWELESSRRYYEETEQALYPWMYLGEPNDGDAEHQILPYGIPSGVRACLQGGPGAGCWRGGVRLRIRHSRGRAGQVLHGGADRAYR